MDILKKEIEEVKAAQAAKRVTEDNLKKYVEEQTEKMADELRKELGL